MLVFLNYNHSQVQLSWLAADKIMGTNLHSSTEGFGGTDFVKPNLVIKKTRANLSERFSKSTN